MTNDDNVPRSTFDDLLRADRERDPMRLPAQHEERPEPRKPGKVAQVATFLLIAGLVTLIVSSIAGVVNNARDDVTDIRPDAAACETLIFGHTELILAQASSVTDFNDRLTRAGTASSLFPECRGLTQEQRKSVTDRVTARLAPIITARALAWSQQ